MLFMARSLLRDVCPGRAGRPLRRGLGWAAAESERKELCCLSATVSAQAASDATCMSGASIASAGAFSRRERARNGTASAETAAPNRYDVAYPHTSAALPSAGCAQTPPVEPIIESNERIVAR